MPQPTVWTDWPVTLRQSPPGGPASEMNEQFFEDFSRRDENLRTRICPGDNLSEQVNAPAFGVWTPISATPSKIWIPSWAELLVVRCTIALNAVLGPDSAAVGFARPKLGTVYGTEMQVRLECVVEYTGGPFMDQPVCVADVGGADGWPSIGVLFNKESVIEIPEAMRDTEQSFTYEVKRNDTSTSYVRVFNDARDAVNGHRHRHWHFLEAM